MFLSRHEQVARHGEPQSVVHRPWCRKSGMRRPRSAISDIPLHVADVREVILETKYFTKVTTAVRLVGRVFLYNPRARTFLFFARQIFRIIRHFLRLVFPAPPSYYEFPPMTQLGETSSVALVLHKAGDVITREL